MKTENKSSKPVLSGIKLEFFYSILTLWESGEKNKVIKDFKSAEVKRFLARLDSRGVRVLFLNTDINKKDFNHKYELYFTNPKGNQGLSLLYHLRNAFAHNDIQLIDNSNIFINHIWSGTLRLKARISFKVLKEFVETIRGQHNLTSNEKKYKKRRK